MSTSKQTDQKKGETLPDPHPFLKWAGGKRQLLGPLLERIPVGWNPEKDPYHELFIGGGALYWALRPTRAFLNDACLDLTACWISLRDHWGDLSKRLKSLQRQYRLDPERVFIEVREWDPNTLDLPTRAARLIFLNKTCFNGIYRVNKAGKFNVGWCKNPKAPILDEENLESCSAQLRKHDTTITCGEFYDRLGAIESGSLVYLDPPYAPTSKTSNFVSYTADKFDDADQMMVFNLALALVNKGVHVMVSQPDNDHEVSRYRSHGFRCDLVPATRRINSKGDLRGVVGEYIITSEGMVR